MWAAGGLMGATGGLMGYTLALTESAPAKRSHALSEPRSQYVIEEEVVRRWWALPAGVSLPLDSGACYRLLFTGISGSASGPDVHDAVFAVEGSIPHLTGAMNCVPTLSDQYCVPALPEHGTTVRLVGDVEFHVRASDWFAHQHHTDARYNRVVLHVVLLCDDERPTRRQDGGIVPTCSLNDLPPYFRPFDLSSDWPCHTVIQRLSTDERARLLRTAGILRFEQKTDAFVERLHEMDYVAQDKEQSREQVYDACLIPALAEALAYGRDRAFFRAAALYLLEQKHTTSVSARLPEPLGRAEQPSPLDTTRLRALRHLLDYWHDSKTGAWESLRAILTAEYGQDGTARVLEALRTLFVEVGLSRGRADIVLCNVVLPFAAAVALIDGERGLAARAKRLYLEHPGLPSNRVTRAMRLQLQLESEPHSACAQQGLHHIYQSTCREKHCAACLVGKWDI